MQAMLDRLDDIKFWFIMRWYWWKHRNDTPGQRETHKKIRMEAFHKSIEEFKNGDYPNDKTYFEMVECLEEAERILK